MLAAPYNGMLIDPSFTPTDGVHWYPGAAASLHVTLGTLDSKTSPNPHPQLLPSSADAAFAGHGRHASCPLKGWNESASHATQPLEPSVGA
jgi:hypothetical protein